MAAHYLGEMTSPQPQPTDKMALAYSGAAHEKQRIVTEDGIGSDMNHTLFAWKGDRLIGVAMLTNEAQELPESRLMAIQTAAALVRHGWEADAFTLVSESYVATSPGDEPLANRFANGDRSVEEALSVLHVETGAIRAMSVPYVYTTPPRGVGWKMPLGEAQPDVKTNEFVQALLASLKMEADEIVGRRPDVDVEEMRAQIVAQLPQAGVVLKLAQQT